MLQAALFVAVVALASLPQARAVSDTFGWLPLWLLAIPSAAWLALWAATRFGDDAASAARRTPRRVRVAPPPPSRSRSLAAVGRGRARAAA